MEKRLNKTIEQYMASLKSDLNHHAAELGLHEEQAFPALFQFIHDYAPLTLTAEDVSKRQRTKAPVFFADRCVARRASGEQCTRRRKGCESLCGTHMKGTPHGVCQAQDGAAAAARKVDVWAQDIQGILYHIDGAGNVYQAEDVMRGTNNPRIIARYEETPAGPVLHPLA